MIKKITYIILNLILFSLLFSITAFADDTVVARDYKIPEEIKGTLISPGVDFAMQKGQDASEVMGQIDMIISSVKSYELNTIYLNVNHKEGIIYPSEYLPSYTSFDAMEYFLQKAIEHDVYIYAIINPTYLLAGDILYTDGYISSSLAANSQKNLQEFINKYSPNAVLIDGYYNSLNEKSFEAYKADSSGAGFEQWMAESATSLVKSLSDIVFLTKPNVEFGLVCDSVWANNSTVPEGSETKAETEMYTDGFIDLNTIFALADIKTVLIKLPGSLTDGSIPFKKTLAWWKDKMTQTGADVAAAIYNDKLATTEKGWDSPDQVLRQIIATRELGGKGVVFTSYQNLAKNSSNNTNLIIKFYKGQVNSQDILTDLAVSRPESLVYSTYEPLVSFYGASDPNFPLLLNDEEIERNEKGVFSLAIELAAGENTFTFTHKTKSVTYVITRNIKIIQKISPEGGMTVEGGTIVPISVYAYKDSSVTATVGGATLTLVAKDHGGDDTDKNSSYVLYTANYECPASIDGEQAIGNIQISATWGGKTETATGANIRVTSRPKPEIGVGQTGSLIEVTAAQARTYPSSVLNSDPSGDSFPLPQGARDFIASDLLTFTSGGVNYSYYILRSGVRINAEDIRVVGDTELVANNITEASVYSEGGFTYLRMRQDQPMGYRATLPGLGFNNDTGITSFTSGSISFIFNQVQNIPEQVSVSENNVFASASITKSETNAVLTLNFHRAGRFSGYRAYYQDGYLIFRFTNIPSSLSGTKIYLDPGHGGADPGTIPIAGMKSEAVLNREMADNVANILRGMGADVRVTDSSMSSVSLDTRLSLSSAYAPHLFVSLHHNSSTAPSAYGTEAWFFNPYSEIYADRISSSVAAALGSRDRGEKYGWYKVTTHMEFPAILVEYGFLSNISEYEKLKSPEYQNAMAQATADAIAATFAGL